MKRDDDDFTLMDRDFDEFIRRGLQEREWESKNLRTEEKNVHHSRVTRTS